jgi:predicted lipoprotein with Yx(FWY)xxD motif
VVGVVAALLVLAACAEPASDATEPTASEAPSATPTPSATEPDPSPAETSGPAGTRVVVDASEFGPMLYSAEGQAIYLFDLEDGPEPRCYGECAAAWPPVLTAGDPVAGRGVRAGLLGIVERRDGSAQVTYGGHPLYFYAHEGPGEVLCHDFFDFGGTWYVVQPDGGAAP